MIHIKKNKNKYEIYDTLELLKEVSIRKIDLEDTYHDLQNEAFLLNLHYDKDGIKNTRCRDCYSKYRVLF